MKDTPLTRTAIYIFYVYVRDLLRINVRYISIIINDIPRYLIFWYLPVKNQRNSFKYINTRTWLSLLYHVVCVDVVLYTTRRRVIEIVTGGTIDDGKGCTG